MKRFLQKIGRVQIRMVEVDNRYRVIKGKFKSITVYETNVEEVFSVIDKALTEEESK